MLRRVVLRREYQEKNISAAGDGDQGAGTRSGVMDLTDDPKTGRPAAKLTMRAGVDVADGQFFVWISGDRLSIENYYCQMGITY